jgi:hypothetical protein
MSVLSLLASTPQISSLRRARDLIDECKRLGLKIVPDEAHEVAAAKLCKCGETKTSPILEKLDRDYGYMRVIPLGDYHG